MHPDITAAIAELRLAELRRSTDHPRPARAHTGWPARAVTEWLASRFGVVGREPVCCPA